jgi:hypothetical protein
MAGCNASPDALNGVQRTFPQGSPPPRLGRHNENLYTLSPLRAHRIAMSSVKERASTAAPHSGDSMDASSGPLSASSSSSSSSSSTSSSSSSSAAPSAAGPVGAPPGAIVLPGDTIALAPGARTRLGAGVWQKQNSVLATRAGQLRCDAANKVWVDCSQRRVRTVSETRPGGATVSGQVAPPRFDIFRYLLSFHSNHSCQTIEYFYCVSSPPVYAGARGQRGRGRARKAGRAVQD